MVHPPSLVENTQYTNRNQLTKSHTNSTHVTQSTHCTSIHGASYIIDPTNTNTVSFTAHHVSQRTSLLDREWDRILLSNHFG